jgi:hypothetical protein
MYMDAYAEAIRPEQIEQAISLAVVTRFKRPHMPLEDCVELAVEQVFCPCLSHHEGEGKMPSMSIRAGIADSIVGYLKQGVCTAWAGSDVPRIERCEHGAETGLRRIHREREATHSHGTLASEFSQQSICGGGGKMPTVAERKRRQDEALDDALAHTFPASDPIALVVSGKPNPPKT